MNIAGLAVSVAFVLTIIALTNALSHAGTFSRVTARKAIHIALAQWWLIAVAMFNDPWVASVGPASGLLASAIVPAVLPLPQETTGRARDRGTICYSAALLVLVNISWRGFISTHAATVGVMVMGWGDGLAGLVGARFGTGGVSIWGRRKTFAGTAAMFFSSCVVTLLLTMAGNEPLPRLFVCIACTALVATLLEFFTPWGLDNLTIAIGTAFFSAGAFG
jgi:phytol kinase